MEKIEKVLKALNEQSDQYARLAKDEALQALIGGVKDRENSERSAMNWYKQHIGVEDAIRTVKVNFK